MSENFINVILIETSPEELNSILGQLEIYRERIPMWRETIEAVKDGQEKIWSEQNPEKKVDHKLVAQCSFALDEIEQMEGRIDIVYTRLSGK